MKNLLLGRFSYIVVPVLSAALALLVGGIILLLLGANPVDAYIAMLRGAWGSPNALADSVVKATPLLFVGRHVTFDEIALANVRVFDGW